MLAKIKHALISNIAGRD